MAMVRTTIGFYDMLEEAREAIRLALADESILAEPEPRIGEWPDGRFIVLGTMEFTEPKTSRMLSGEWDREVELMNEESGRVRIVQAVKEYCEKYCIPPPFDISEAQHEVSPENWPKITIPFSTEKGCYVFYSDLGEILYVGKASMTSDIGTRAACHIHSKTAVPTDLGWSTPLPKWLLTIRVRAAYEAASLEEYLISKLGPLYNKLGVRDP
jgi:hypothetical protein